jgi:hypothetical protein
MAVHLKYTVKSSRCTEEQKVSVFSHSFFFSSFKNHHPTTRAPRRLPPSSLGEGRYVLFECRRRLCRQRRRAPPFHNLGRKTAFWLVVPNLIGIVRFANGRRFVLPRRRRLLRLLLFEKRRFMLLLLRFSLARRTTSGASCWPLLLNRYHCLLQLSTCFLRLSTCLLRQLQLVA